MKFIILGILSHVTGLQAIVQDARIIHEFRDYHYSSFPEFVLSTSENKASLEFYLVLVGLAENLIRSLKYAKTVLSNLEAPAEVLNYHKNEMIQLDVALFKAESLRVGYSYPSTVHL
ncbi:MAG: hypothetical protein CME64_05500 [Halobacteriovoraceae bacterium]|nr:hypothetical protein [Halobacteriovoraceae bacterium]